MKRISILMLLLCTVAFSFSQSDSIHIDKKAKNRYVFWLIPSDAYNIYGIAIGHVGSKAKSVVFFKSIDINTLCPLCNHCVPL